MMANAIRDCIEPDRITIDLPEKNAAKFISRIAKSSDSNVKDIRAEHKADQLYPEVSAASIMAKTARDRHIDNLSSEIGFDLGTGYPHDEKTIEFIKSAISKKEVPNFVRKSWQTVRKIEYEN